MSAGKYNFIIEQGSTLSFEIQYNDANGTPIDLTGYSARMDIRSALSGSGTTYLSLTSSIGDTYTKESGSAFISVSGSNLTKPTTSGSLGIYAGWELTEALSFTNEAFYDLELTTGSIKTRILEGKAKLSKQVTD